MALVLAAGPAAAAPYPAFTAYVVDAAGAVPDDVERRVDAELREYEARTGNQVAVAVVATTSGESIEAYSLGLANAWGVGRRGVDNGVVLVVATADRRVRIEVGRGLEAVLTDQAAAGVVNDGLVQRLAAGDVGGGIAFATAEIRRRLGATASPGAGAPPARAPAPGPGAGSGTDLGPWVVGGGMATLAVLAVRRARRFGPMAVDHREHGERQRETDVASPAASRPGGGSGHSGGGGGSFGGGGASGSW